MGGRATDPPLWRNAIHSAYVTGSPRVNRYGGAAEPSFRQHGDAVQHVAYWLDDSQYDAAAAHLESSGYPLIQGFRLPIARVGYSDTRSTIGAVTELVGANEEGHVAWGVKHPIDQIKRPATRISSTRHIDGADADVSSHLIVKSLEPALIDDTVTRIMCS